LTYKRTSKDFFLNFIYWQRIISTSSLPLFALLTKDVNCPVTHAQYVYGWPLTKHHLTTRTKKNRPAPGSRQCIRCFAHETIYACNASRITVSIVRSILHCSSACMHRKCFWLPHSTICILKLWSDHFWFFFHIEYIRSPSGTDPRANIKFR